MSPSGNHPVLVEADSFDILLLRCMWESVQPEGCFLYWKQHELVQLILNIEFSDS